MRHLNELHQPNHSSANSPMQWGLSPIETVPSQGVDVGGILSRRKWLVILGFILGLGLGYIYMLQATPRYESVAQILIEDKQPPTIPLTGVESQYITTSAEAIKRRITPGADSCLRLIARLRLPRLHDIAIWFECQYQSWRALILMTSAPRSLSTWAP